MNIARIPYLFGSVKYDSSRKRMITVLSACCRAAKIRAADSQKRGYLNPLTAEVNGFNIDDVMQCLPTYTGTCTHPEFRKQFSIWETLSTIRSLMYDGYLSDDNGDFEVITLTDHLFKAISEEWAYAIGVRPFFPDGKKIFARSSVRASQILYRRLHLR